MKRFNSWFHRLINGHNGRYIGLYETWLQASQATYTLMR